MNIIIAGDGEVGFHLAKSLTELDCNGNIERMLLQAQSQMNVCLARNRQEIINSNNK